MIQELETLTPEFAGFTSHTWCFLHIVNLVTKLLLCQFDVKKETIGRDAEMVTLADKLVREEEMMDETEDNDNDDDIKADNEDGWVDELENMTENERIKLEESIRTVKLALAKVS